MRTLNHIALTASLRITWGVEFADELDAEWDALPLNVQDELLTHAKLLAQFGPQLAGMCGHQAARPAFLEADVEELIALGKVDSAIPPTAGAGAQSWVF